MIWTIERPNSPLYGCLVVLRQGNDELVADGSGTDRDAAIRDAEISLSELLAPERSEPALVGSPSMVMS